MAERFDPAQLVAWLDERQGFATLRSVARRLQIDPAVLCRPLSAAQADRYATALGAHPGEVWVEWWANA
jgi:lambda repressor-like predicted transcriptional regulator